VRPRRRCLEHVGLPEYRLARYSIWVNTHIMAIEIKVLGPEDAGVLRYVAPSWSRTATIGDKQHTPRRRTPRR
jgi:hypothetical protein